MTPSADEKFMKLALREARKGLGMTAPNPPVGAVIVDGNDEIVSKGWHRRAGEPHAEVDAIHHAAAKGVLSHEGHTIYVTLEPCSTSGKTPPCCGAIIAGRFRRVVIATIDPNPAHAGAGIELLRQAGIEVSSGICQPEADHLIRGFAKHVITGRPFLIAKTAITLDGRTTLAPGHGQWLTGAAARSDVHKLRTTVDAILIGGETLRRDNPRLTIRGRPMSHGRLQPFRIVITAREDLPVDAHVFTDEYSDRTVVRHGESLTEVLDELGRLGITTVMLESGGRLFSHAIAKNLIDEVVLYIAPVIGGGSNRLMPADDIMASLSNVKIKTFGSDLRVTGVPARV